MAKNDQQHGGQGLLAPCSAFARMLFVWAKNGRIVCLSPDEIRGREDDMKAEGWNHTATLDPARWIEAMANDNCAPSDMLDELQFPPNDKGLRRIVLR